MTLRRLLLGLTVLALAMVSALSVDAGSHVPGSSGSVSWAPGTPQLGQAIASEAATLVRQTAGATATVRTTRLAPGGTVRRWWVVFNNPEHCTTVTARYRCSTGDVLVERGDPAVAGSLVCAAGAVVPNSGEVAFDAFLPANADSDIVLAGPGLVDPLEAAIHLMLRDHGPLIEWIASQQLGTFGGGCDNAPEGTGAPGPFACANVQFAVPVQ